MVCKNTKSSPQWLLNSNCNSRLTTVGLAVFVVSLMIPASATKTATNGLYTANKQPINAEPECLLKFWLLLPPLQPNPHGKHSVISNFTFSTASAPQAPIRTSSDNLHIRLNLPVNKRGPLIRKIRNILKRLFIRLHSLLHRLGAFPISIISHSMSSHLNRIQQEQLQSSAISILGNRTWQSLNCTQVQLTTSK